MENAVDALKIAFAVFVFVIALALALAVIGQVRTTSDVILALGDKTNEYEYVEIDENNANNEDRIVGFETILPTIYRYPSEQYAVTILDTIGQPIVRYDLYTESFMKEWDNILKLMKSTKYKEEVESSYEKIKDRIEIVDTMLQEEFGSNYHGIWNSLVNESNYESGDLYKAISNNSAQNIKQSAPWGSDTQEILKRIKADFETDVMKQKYERNGITYYGKKLNNYKDKKFKEKFIEIQTSGTTITEDEYSLETVKGNKTLEIVYIMQPN